MKKEMVPDVIRACTPLFLATVGGLIGLAVLTQPKLSEGRWAAGLGLASTAIAGAAGLAQNTKFESNITTAGNSQVTENNPAQASGTR